MSPERTGFASRFAGLVARHYLGKPDQAELLQIRYPDLASLGWGALNETAFLLNTTRSIRLHTLNLELTNRCNLRCVYCPVNRSLKRDRAEMPFDQVKDLFNRTPSIRNLLPFQWGEPLLHPHIFDILSLASSRGIRSFLTTNGTFLGPHEQEALLRSGVHRLTVSVDGNDEVHLKTRGVELAPIRERLMELKQRRDGLGSSMRIDVSMVLDADTQPFLDEFFAAWKPVVDRVQAIPRMIPGSRTTACREPWRGLLVVLADGRVTTCCSDSEGSLSLGNIHDETLNDIFNGDRMKGLRKAHGQGAFPAACAQCSEYSHPNIHRRFQ